MHSKNKALMCKVFPSSLGSVAIRWFNGLGAGSIDSFKELTQAFGSRLITCIWVPRPLDSSFSLSMREGETLKTGAYHRGLQNPMESSGVASWREKVAAIFVSA